VKAWAYDDGLPEHVSETGENTYLPGFEIPSEIRFTNDIAEALAGAELVLLVIPSGYMRSVTQQAARYVPGDAIIVSTAKGIERESNAMMSEVFRDTLGAEAVRATYLSGPSFAKDMAMGLPADVTLAARDIELARKAQEYLHSPRFRVYASDDVIGVQLGGALKNVIAVACGATSGLGMGASALASLMTRGLAEVTRLGVALGANPLTFLGLAGVGDLTLTCTGDLSRNRQLGQALAKGERAKDILKAKDSVAEGFYTSAAVHRLARRAGVEMPISEAVYNVCHEDASLADEAQRLMRRDKKDELAGI